MFGSAASTLALIAVQVATAGLALGAPPTPTAATAPVKPVAPVEWGVPMADYQRALAARRLGATSAVTPQVLRARLVTAQELASDGRTDEVIALLLAVIESPRFADFSSAEEGHAAVYALGDALASVGAHDAARAYLKRLLALDPNDTFARRAVRRLVDIALETMVFAPIADDLARAPSSGQPEETRGELSYLRGRAREQAGDPAGALAAYGEVTQKSRFWAQAVYLSGLIELERGRYREAENLFCKVADPARSEKTAPFFADEKFFVVRDHARLALGRVAHEQFRFDDARYYYYLVPQDSDRLAESLYESATGRYEKKDYQAASDLLAELQRVDTRHRYQDEAWILRAYTDLARCHFEEADRALRGFIAQYEPVRDAARRVRGDERALGALVLAVASASDAGVAVGGVRPDAARSLAVLVRLDPSYVTITQRIALLDRQMSGLRGAAGQLDGLSRALDSGAAQPTAPTLALAGETAVATGTRARQETAGLSQQLAQLERAGARPGEVAALRRELALLEARIVVGQPATAGRAATPTTVAETDLSRLLSRDHSAAGALLADAEVVRAKLEGARAELAKDAVTRLDLRLSRLLRRARLGRIESVLGRKRALEVEVEALAAGVLPRSALDALDSARYLQENEEYWPFEGDDWPDEYVGGEGLQ